MELLAQILLNYCQVRRWLYEEEVGGVGIVLHVQLRLVQLLFTEASNAMLALQHSCRTGEHLGMCARFDKLERRKLKLMVGMVADMPEVVWCRLQVVFNAGGVHAWVKKGFANDPVDAFLDYLDQYGSAAALPEVSIPGHELGFVFSQGKSEFLTL